MSVNPHLYQPTDDDLAAEVIPHAATRQYRNRHSATNQGIVSDADVLGVLGEQAVCAFFGEDPDDRIQSAQHTDGWFLDIAGVKIKAFATKHPGHIIVKEGKVTADVYVLAYVHPSTNWTTCLGWAHRTDILAAPLQAKSNGAYAIKSHWYPHTRTRPLGPLRDRLRSAAAAGTPAHIEDIAPILT